VETRAKMPAGERRARQYSHNLYLFETT